MSMPLAPAGQSTLVLAEALTGAVLDASAVAVLVYAPHEAVVVGVVETTTVSELPAGTLP
jgi:hypothetical protein